MDNFIFELFKLSMEGIFITFIGLAIGFVALTLKG